MKNYIRSLFTFLLLSELSIAQSSGPFVPMNYYSGGTGISWANLSGVQAVDNNPAYADLAQFPTCNNNLCYYSNVAVFTGFGFSVPTGATVTGIKAEILQRVNSPGGGIHDSELVLTVFGITHGNNYASPFNWLDTPTISNYGDSTDTWGYAWTPTLVNDPTFGLSYRITNTSYDQAASVDHMTMTVYYQTGSGIQSQTSSPIQMAFSKSTLAITGTSSILNTGGKLQVLTMNGAVIAEKYFEPGSDAASILLDASQWACGVYAVNIISSSGEKISRKVFRENVK